MLNITFFNDICSNKPETAFLLYNSIFLFVIDKVGELFAIYDYNNYRTFINDTCNKLHIKIIKLSPLPIRLKFIVLVLNLQYS